MNNSKRRRIDVRNKWLTIAFLAMLALALAACGGRGNNAEPAAEAPAAEAPAAEAPAAEAPAEAEAVAAGDPAKGRELFVTCSACHGPEGQGVQGLGKDMTHSEFIAGLSDAELLAFIKQGRSVSDPLNTTGVDMPPKGGNPALTDEQLMDIIAFIREIHQG